MAFTFSFQSKKTPYFRLVSRENERRTQVYRHSQRLSVCSGIHNIGTLSLYYRSQSSDLHSSGQLSLVQRHRYITYKAVNREDKPSRRYRDRDIAKFESSRRYRQR